MNAIQAHRSLRRPVRGSRARVGRVLSVLVLAMSLAATGASPAGATEDLTGDITPPEIVTLELQPPSVDVTDSAATVTVTARFTDADTGVTGAVLVWQSPVQETHTWVAQFTLVSGTEADGVYTASMPIPRAAAPGRWPLDVQVRDRVGNTGRAQAADLERAGLPGYLDVVSRNPDVTPPDVVAVEVLPAQVDVRSGPGALTVRIRLVDDAAGVDGVFVPPMSPHGGSGGAEVPVMRLVSGTPNDGWWEGELRIAEHAHAGDWSFAVRPRDVLANNQELSAADLAARGMSASFSVLSYEDVTPPAFTAASLSAVAVDVSDADQQLSFKASVTDAVSGVYDYSWGDSNVQVSLQHPVGQLVGQAGMPRTSGTATDGEYATSLTFPRHSATGLWTVYLWATDGIGNGAYVSPVQLAELGLPPAVLVYNTPLPPLDIAVKPGDAEVLVQWQPPSDDRGAEVTEYVVRELPEGRTVTVPADALSAVVPDLDNGIEHSFVVHAVNRAGESDPSQRVAAVPAAGLGLPASGPSPSPAPAPSSGAMATPSVAVAPAVISAGQRVTVTYRGTPGDTVSVWSKTQPATVYSRIATVTLDANGFGSTSHAPHKNTRIMARSSDGRTSVQPLIQVRSVASLNVRRVATRTFAFTGTVSPALSGRLVSLYRNGVLVAQARTSSTGVYVIRKTLAAGTFDFHVRTGNDTYNLGATSRSIRVRIY